VNRFTDALPEEWAGMMGYDKAQGFARRASMSSEVNVHKASRSMAELPTSVDWRSKGAVRLVSFRAGTSRCRAGT
jgi:hypothetical protein